jgi:LmbE family N-acetylglucosaminyl deacetylase
VSRFTERVAGWLIRHAVPGWNRSGLWLALSEVQTFEPPRLLERLPGDRILVLAPHPDDESLGCGGTLRKCTGAGARARVVFVTDGRLGSRGVRSLPEGARKRQLQSELVRRREQEARAALEVLGVAESDFLGLPEGEPLAADALGARLAPIVEAFAPDLILLPFLTDRHRDHAAVGAGLVQALQRLGLATRARPLCAGYEIWSPIDANVLVDVTDHVDCKREAIQRHRSQLGDVDYATAILALNRYRSASGLFAEGYAEAFFVAPADVFTQLQRRVAS